MAAPSAFRVHQVITMALAALDELRGTHGVILDTEDEVRLALAEEGIDVDTVLRRLVLASIQARSDEEAASSRIKDLIARRDRFAAHKETYRKLIIWLAGEMGKTNMTDPEFTLSIRPGAAKVLITDASALPHGYFVTERVPLKTNIADALKRGEAISGASLSNSPSVLTIRTK